MGILVMLGTALIVILRGGLATWRRAEARQASYASGTSVLAQLREDLTATAAPFAARPVEAGPVDVRFVCDSDEADRPRLILVRSMKAESEHPITGLAGTTIGADRVIDQRGDLEEARASRLRATGGLCEVAWVLGPGDVLYRGVRAPIGPPGSLFDDQAPYELAPLLSAEALASAPPPPAPGVVEALDDVDLPALLRPFATDVIHFELRFWTQFTSTWDVAEPPRRTGGERSGPLLHWDSTRALLAAVDPSDRRRFETWKSRASLDDARDDIIPSKVMITLVVREPPAAGTSTFLTRPVKADGDELVVQEANRLPGEGYVRLEGEWVHYREVRGDRLVVAERGARGTVAADHDLVEVVAGRTFSLIVDIPAQREDWSERE